MLKPRLFTPGPTPVPEETLLELAKPVTYHRTAEQKQILGEVLEDLRYVYQTKNDILCLTSSGTGGMEAAVSNLLAPGKKAILLTAGRWGERWRGIMNKTLEESRAFASEPVTDLMEVFVSPGAVRAVQDKLNEEQLKKADAVVERFALTVVRLASRQEDGSRIVEEEAVEAAEKATCPVYPFCSE